MSFTIKPAARQGIKPLIALYGESGTGKTYSALLMARGLAGPTGKIVMVDSESGRGSLYADVLPGGYETLEMTEPFAPDRYIEAMREVEQSGARIGLLDSGSHEWEGVGGVLDMASDNEARNGKSLNVWRGPKMEHAKFVLRLLQSPIPWIVCLRAKYKTRQGKDEKGKTVIVKDDHTTPIQADDFIFECTAHAEIFHDHTINLTKWSHPSLKECFPVKGPITIKTGEAIGRWCEAPMQSAPKPDAERNALAVQLWKLLEPHHKGHRDALPAVEQHLWDETFMNPDERLGTLPVERMRTIIEKLNARAKPTAQPEMELTKQ